MQIMQRIFVVLLVVGATDANFKNTWRIPTTHDDDNKKGKKEKSC